MPRLISPSAIDIEYDLRSRLAGRRLVGELGIDEEEFRTIREAVEELARLRYPADRLKASYYALLATYLTYEGVYSYDSGLWPHVVQGLGPSNVLGDTFKQSTRKLGLESFDDLIEGEGAQQYIARILAHGGIPRYCLNDFFQAFTSDTRLVRTAGELIALWRTRRERLAHVDKPVGRFLLYGGDVAHDLLARFIEIVDQVASSGTAPSQAEAGLPNYILEAFVAFRRKRPTAFAAGGISLPRPRVELDPWSTLGPQMILPTCARPGDWKLVVGEGSSRLVGTSVDREQMIGLSPARMWEASLAFDGVMARTNAFEAVESMPALFFEPVAATLVRDPLALHLDDVLLLAADDLQISAIGEDGGRTDVRVIERLPEPSGAWHGYKLSRIDLGGVARLRLRWKEEERTVRVVKPDARPRLDAEPVGGVTTEGGAPVYDSPPPIAIPPLLRQLNWSLRLRAGSRMVGASSHERVESIEVASLLPQGFMGELTVSLTGALGFDLHERIAIVPGIAVRLPERLLMPDEEAVIDVTCDERIFVDGKAGAATVPVDPDGTGEVGFTVGSSDSVPIGLRVRINKVAWGVAGAAGTPLSAREIVVDGDDVDSGRAQGLVVRSGKAGTQVALQLVSSREVLQRCALELTGGIDGRWTFALGQFAETARTSREASLRLQLDIGGRIVDAVRIATRYVATIGEVSSRLVDDFAEVAVHFDESSTIRDRVLKLWSLDRPWESAVEASIPDGARASFAASWYHRLVAGEYLVEIAIDDGWTTAKRPRVGASSTRRVRLGEQSDQRRRLARLEDDDLLGLLERSIVDHDVSDETLERLDFGPAAGEALTTFCQMLEDVERGAQLPRRVEVVRKILVDSATGFFRALIDAAERGLEPDVTRRVALLAAPRLCRLHDDVVRARQELSDEEIRDVWRVSRLAGAVVDFPSENDPEGDARREDFIGSVDAAEGFALTQRMIGCSAEQLRGIGKGLGIVPGRVFDRSTLEWAYLELLIAENENCDVRPSAWFEAHRSLLNGVSTLIGSPIEQRNADAGTEKWASVPAVVLAAAFHVRCRTREDLRALCALDEALLFAPTLVQHDLIYAESLARTLGGATRWSGGVRA